jgi:hypothetical protein
MFIPDTVFFAAAYGVYWLCKRMIGLNAFYKYHINFQHAFFDPIDFFSLQNLLEIDEKYKLDYENDREFVDEFIACFKKYLAYTYLNGYFTQFKQDKIFGSEYIYFRSLASFCKCLLYDTEYDVDLSTNIHCNGYYNHTDDKNKLRKNGVEIKRNNSFYKRYALTHKGVVVSTIAMLAYEKQADIVNRTEGRKAQKNQRYKNIAIDQSKIMRQILDEEAILEIIPRLWLTREGGIP